MNNSSLGSGTTNGAIAGASILDNAALIFNYGTSLYGLE
jgi:hypothetical protein